MSTKYDIFISYSRRDLKVVREFVEGLCAQMPDLVCFFDVAGIEYGEESDEKIIDAIDNSSYVLYFLSPNSMKSKWTKEEVMYAKNCKKKVIPILLSGAQLEGWFLFHFGRINYSDISNVEQVKKLINDLSTWTNKKIVEQKSWGKSSTGHGDQSVSERSGEAESRVRKGPSDDTRESADSGTTTVAPANNVGIVGRTMRVIMANKKLIGIILLLLGSLFLCGILISKCGKDSVDSTDYISPADSTENVHEYVDLGLSVKWATCNVGASKPENYGDYFAWGETKPKSTYSWSTYKWCRGNRDNLTKYCTDSDYGTVDNKIQLELSDDAARANWGGSWRMPTHDEWTELREKCTWTWTTQNGVEGYKVTSKTNGRSIFLPAAGYRNDSSLGYAGSDGYYWSSSLNTGNPYSARFVDFYSSVVGWGYYNRYYGQSVRPVCL